MKQIVRGEIVLDNIVMQQPYTSIVTDYALVVDTETHTDIAQKCKIAMYGLFNLKDASSNPSAIQYASTGIAVYDLSAKELAILQAYCKLHNVKLLSRDTFITKVLFPALAQGVLLANHNIPFDIGAMASDFAIDDNKFHFKLCYCGETNDIPHTHEKIAIPCSIHPTIVVQYLRTHKYLMYVEDNNYAPIVDTLTLGDALLGKTNSSSLNGMIRRYGFKDDKKKEIDSYSGEYNEKFFEYAMHDVYLTSKLLSAEYKLYLQHDINKPFHTIMSEASIGKAYNEKLGIPPFKQTHTEVKSFMYNLANRAYYGARSEIHIRRKPVQVLYCDFKSQYPLVNALLQSQKYLLAEYVQIHHCIDLAQELIDTITLEDLQDKETWSYLSILVKVQTYGHILPTRFSVNKVTAYGETISNDSNHTAWYSLLDVVASKIRTGKAPRILDAYRLIPHGSIQTNKLNVLGNSTYNVDLTHDDFFVKVIDLRDGVKAELKQVKLQLKDTPTDELYQRRNYLDNLQLALKLMANSTSYGILVETREVQKQDIAGKYNAQPIGIHITAGARLLLAIAETLGLRRGIEHGLCDTDSFAYAKPDDMSFDAFYANVQDIINWFTPLSPYASKGAIFELEEYNFINGVIAPLYLYGISPKRYVLYNKGENETYVIRKMSEHGISNFSTDNEIALPDDMLDIPRNEENIRSFRTERYCLWYRAIQYAEKNIAPYVPIELWSSQLALTQKSISSSRLYGYYRYIPEIRPFSFFTMTPQSKNKKNKYRYYMPFISDDSFIQDMLHNGNVRKVKTNEVVCDISIDTLRDRLVDFFIHTENKFDNGDDTGTMNRRTITDVIIEQHTRSGKQISDSTQSSLWSSDNG